MKKFLSLFTVLSIICTATGCAGGSVTINSSTATEPEYSSTTASPALTTVADTKIEVPDVLWDIPTSVTDDVYVEESWGFSADEAEVGGSFDGMEAPSDCIIPISPEEPTEPLIPPAAGLLTGGEWNDNDHWHDWISLYQTHEDWAEFRDYWQTEYTENRIELKITSNGMPLAGAIVKCDHMSAVTDNTGTAYLFYSTKKEENYSVTDVGRNITVEYNGITEQICNWYNINDYIEYELQSDVNTANKTLDLMLMVDTTGSMMDELSYLQEELKDVINRIKQDNGNIPIRVSVNFYRDEGDDYVIRDFPFTTDIDTAINEISAQDANGGGDTPEAVHTALDSALNNHDWQDNSTKLMFFVLDAPPHSDPQIVDSVNSLTIKAAEMGVRIIPVASSGIDKSTEYLLRTMSFVTGGTYTFLTDHSGIGGNHIEPTIGAYEIEKLNDMMVRIVNEYLA